MYKFKKAWGIFVALGIALLFLSSVAFAGPTGPASSPTTPEAWCLDGNTWKLCDTSKDVELTNLEVTGVFTFGGTMAGDLDMNAYDILNIGEIIAKTAVAKGVIIKGTTNDGTTNILTLQDSDGADVLAIDSNGGFTPPVGGGSPGGSTTQIQYNDAGAFAGASLLKWEEANNRLVFSPLGTATAVNTTYDSSLFRMEGSGWDTNDLVARTLVWRMKVVPTSATVPYSSLVLEYSNDDTTFINPLTWDDQYKFWGTNLATAQFGGGWGWNEASARKAFFNFDSTADQIAFLSTSGAGNQLIMGNFSAVGQDYDHADLTDLVFYVQDRTLPNVTNNRWIGFMHENSTGVGVIMTGDATGAGTTPATIDNGISFRPRGTEQFKIDGNGYHKVKTVSLADDAYIDLPTGVSGWGTIYVADNEEYANISWKADGTVTIIAGSANFVNTDTDTKFCAFDNGTNVRIRNRLGSTKAIKLIINY